MFTGIIEALGTIRKIEPDGSNLHFNIESPISSALAIDQSVSHNGVCLTVVSVGESWHRVTAIDETLKKTALRNWQTDDEINLERCLPMNGRLDGHLVQGHVDAVGSCRRIIEKDGSWEYTIAYPTEYANLLIEKGSICLNGISLTVFNLGNEEFTVAIIPYTYEHTTMHSLLEGDELNLEFDLVGKYIVRNLQLSSK